MTELTYTLAAERDLARIALTIAIENERAALRLIADLRRHCGLLAGVPFMGRPRDELGKGIRSFPHGAYVVYYLVRADIDRVDVLRIWHGRRRLPTMADLL